MSNDEPLFDSDVDPKRIKNVADGLRRQGEFESARMLDSYAVMLAAAPQQAAEPVRQFRVVPKGSVWTDVKDPEIWASVIAHPKSYETRVLYTHPQPAQDAKDAARYRWLRDKSGRDGQPYIRCDDPPFKPLDYWVTAGTADVCIDRAMAKDSGR